MSTEAKCNCQHCSEHISFPTEMAGQMTVCPHCGLETKLYVPAFPQDVRAEIKRGVSPLGIASLVLGIVACLFCWIPFLGLFIIPISAIGFLLAGAGIIMAGVSKRTGFAFPISGLVVCVLSVFIAFAMTGVLATIIQQAVTQEKQTNKKANLRPALALQTKLSNGQNHWWFSKETYRLKFGAGQNLSRFSSRVPVNLVAWRATHIIIQIGRPLNGTPLIPALCYRGHDCDNWKLLPKLCRTRTNLPIDLLKQDECDILAEFRSRFSLHDWTVAEVMAYAQHHGAPTRLLDWSRNPFVGFLESVPAVSAKLKTPVTADRKFADVVKSAQDAAVLVLVY